MAIKKDPTNGAELHSKLEKWVDLKVDMQNYAILWFGFIPYSSEILRKIKRHAKFNGWTQSFYYTTIQ